MFINCIVAKSRKGAIMKTEERVFFQKIKQAIWANPFGVGRQEVDLEISGLPRRSPSEEILQALMEKVLVRVKKYCTGTARCGEQLSRSDRELLQFGVLFYVFHLFCDAYDAHIENQIKSGKDSLKVVFAREILGMMTEFGFSDREAVRYFSLFFQLRRGFYFISGISGVSRSVRELRQALWNNIFTYDVGVYERYLWNRMEDFSTILLGETGVGKGMAAAAIGRSGFIPFNEKKECFEENFAQIFISINLSQYSEQLIESELFGHRKGAFTGAVDHHKGVFACCSPYGSIFLDEIGEVSIPVQINLLQVLQERFFCPVGSHEPEKFHGRVIAATNQPLDDLRTKGRFRDDFYYRLCSDTIEVPSLRQRLREDAGELKIILSSTLSRILGYTSKPLEREILKRIKEDMPADYSWPGNIRELEQCVRRMLLKRRYDWTEAAGVLKNASEIQERFLDGALTANELLASYCGHLYRKLGSYEKVARQIGVDRRTVKRYVDMAV